MQIGKTLPPEQAEEGPAELIFVHAGHTAKVNDISWNPNVHTQEYGDLQNEWMLASVGDDNVLQIWQPAEAIYNDSKSDQLDLNYMWRVCGKQGLKGT